MTETVERESMDFDVVIVGAGPSGLAAAIRLKQLAAEKEREINVVVVEKGSEVGAHILSGAVIDPHSLDELFPDWRETDCPLTTPAAGDRFYFLTEKKAIRLPAPPQMNNHGNFVISLGNLCRWLGERAEELGVEIFPGFAAAEYLTDEAGAVCGIATGDMGIGADGEPTPNFEPGVELRAPYTLFAEGCRGSLSQKLIEKFDLAAGCDPQIYGIGIKELWEIDPAHHQPGLITHTVGWPMDRKTYGGSFLYHLENNQVSVGMVIGLDYENPHLSPFDEMQRFKLHPSVAPIFEGAKRIAYGARALNEGGYQSIPKLVFPGGALIGDGAGFMNVPKIKGSHAALKSGLLAAEAVFQAFADGAKGGLDAYPQGLEKSWLIEELRLSRNIRPSFRWGLFGGILYSAIDTYLLRGRAPWTMHHEPDHEKMKKAAEAPAIDYPKPDGVVTFDRNSSVYLSATNHEEDQPVHLVLADEARALSLNLAEYGGPEALFCPAGVYEFPEEGGRQRLQINAQNCLHCKTCDIKDVTQNITWTVPEGGGGPNYPNM